MKIYAVLDNKAKTFNAPFFQPNQVAAVRAFNMEVNRADPLNAIHQHPEDFDLYYIGDYNTETGQLLPHEPELLVTAIKLKKE